MRCWRAARRAARAAEGALGLTTLAGTAATGAAAAPRPPPAAPRPVRKLDPAALWDELTGGEPSRTELKKESAELQKLGEALLTPTRIYVKSCLAAARTGNPLVASMLEEVQASDERLTAARRAFRRSW